MSDPGSVEVLIPWRGGCPHRERALEWTQGRLPWPSRLGPGPDPWCKAAAVTPALEACEAEIVIVADADCWTPGLPEAVEAVERGAPWAIPHRAAYRLTDAATRRFIAGAPWTELWTMTVERPQIGARGGGFVVARRETLLDIPLDPRYVGWGQEDHSWGLALDTLTGGCWRGKAPLIHLWHPPQPRRDRQWGSDASERLFRRYVAARNDPAQMRSLIEEAKCSRTFSPTT